MQVPVPKIGDAVVDTSGNTGVAKYDPNTGQPLVATPTGVLGQIPGGPAPVIGTPTLHTDPNLSAEQNANNAETTNYNTTTTTVGNPGDPAYFSRLGTTPQGTALQNILSTATPAPNLDQIRADKAAQAQKLIDSITADYATKASAETIAGTNREGRTRALNTSSGLGGSSTASSEAQKTEDFNTQQQGLITQERDAKIQAVLADVEDRASAEYEQQRQDYLKENEDNYQKITDFQNQNTATATKNATTLAASGVTLASLKTNTPDVYQQLLSESGYQPAVFDAIYNNSLPANQKRDYTYQNINGHLYAISVNPGTNKVETDEIATPGDGYDQFLIAPDGTPLFINKKDGTVKTAPNNYGKNTGGTGSGNVTSGGLTISKDEIGQEAAYLDSTRGDDGYGAGKGYVDTAKYVSAYNDWINQKGLPQDFIKQYPPAKYLNPNDPTVPASLRPAKASTSYSS